MKLFFATVQDAVTNQPMLVRVDMIQKIYESELNNVPCRVIHFVNGDIEYVTNSLESIAKELRYL